MMEKSTDGSLHSLALRVMPKQPTTNNRTRSGYHKDRYYEIKESPGRIFTKVSGQGVIMTEIKGKILKEGSITIMEKEIPQVVMEVSCGRPLAALIDLGETLSRCLEGAICTQVTRSTMPKINGVTGVPDQVLCTAFKYEGPMKG